MKIPQYTKYSEISITLSVSKSSAQIIKKEFLEIAYCMIATGNHIYFGFAARSTTPPGTN